MRVLIIGGYGFIGLAIARVLHAAGHAVTGLGRSAAAGPRAFPNIRWVHADLRSLRSAADWRRLMENMDVVVNAAGALQDGMRDNVEQVHHLAIAALVAACEQKKSIRLIQISAPGARTDSSTDFMRSKARADLAIRSSGIDWVILRPGLVLGSSAYGGSALLRAMAAFPVVLPVALPDRRIQAVAASDVARVVLEAAEGRIPGGSDLDLVEDEPHSLRHIEERLRAWMGVPPAIAVVPMPTWALRLVSKVADVLGYLGWRSPLRSTAIRALEEEVLGNPEPLRRIRGSGLSSLDRLLENMPAGIQERWHARLYLLMPLAVATLSAFWIASGAVGALDVERSARTIPATALPHATSSALVVVGSAVDFGLGIAILCRPLARLACLGMVFTSALYLVAGCIFVPSLWLDPLGPLVKIFPAIVLALATLVMLEER